MTESGSSRLGADEEIDDPGRDPVGLHPPRDILDAPGGMSGEPGYDPGHRSRAERQADQHPDEPPTGTGEGGA